MYRQRWLILFWSVVLLGQPLWCQSLYFLEIPGIKGDAAPPAPTGWIACRSVVLRLPGMPSPTRLHHTAPKQKRGMIDQENLAWPYCTITLTSTKTNNPINTAISRAFQKKRRFRQWHLVLLKKTGEPIITFIFKNVTISRITNKKNGEKNIRSVTFGFGKVIWDYRG